MSFSWGHSLPEYNAYPPQIEDAKRPEVASTAHDDIMSDNSELARTLSSSSLGSVGYEVPKPQDWGEFLLSTCNPTHVKLARRNASWRRAFASPTSNLYQNEMTGETHVCDFNCNSWVERRDGIRVCAISGKSLNAYDRRRTFSSESAASLRKRKSPRPECDDDFADVENFMQVDHRPFKRRQSRCEY